MSAQQIGQRRPSALIGNVHQRDAGRTGEIFAGDVVDRADTGGAEIDLAGIGLGIGDQFGDVGSGKRRMHHQRRLARCRSCRSAQNPCADRSRRSCTATARSPACRCSPAAACSRRARSSPRPWCRRCRRPRPVVDHDALAEQLAHLVGDHASDDRGAAARRERNHQRDGAVRKVLRARRARRCPIAGSRRRQSQVHFFASHVLFVDSLPAHS